MVKQSCPKDRLFPLIQDELSSEESGVVMNHLEVCPRCQSELTALTAHPSWWQRATQGLSGVAVDDRGRLPDPKQSVCSVEALLETRGDAESPADATEAVVPVLDAPAHPEMLGRIDEFDIEERIGQGGM